MDELFDEEFPLQGGKQLPTSASAFRESASKTASEGSHPLNRQGTASDRAGRSGSSRAGGEKVADQQDRLSYPVHEYLEAALEKQREREAEKLKPTSLPLLIGVFEFPWHIQTIGAWIPMSLLLLVAGGMQACLFTFGVQAGLLGVRTIGVSAFIATVIALGYAAACCTTVIEETADGNVAIQEWPGALQWKDWAWNLVFMLVMLLESALIAFIPTFWIGLWTWIPTILLTLAVFPIVYLASSEEGAWAPTSVVIYRSLATRPLLWLAFYVEYFVVMFAWDIVTFVAILIMQWWALLVACPLLAAVMLIEARLLGRVAWCIGKSA
jgi:hypothetical protein